MPAKLKLSTLALIVAAAVGVSSCSTNDAADDVTNSAAENPAPTPEPVVYEQYVALGDSYAAMGSRSAATTGPAACVRSDDNYPNHVANHERVESFTDVSCSSGVTEDIVTPRETAEGPVAPQADALTPSTDLITVSIGGNDLGFPQIVSCFQAAIASGAPSDCASQFQHVDVVGDLSGKLDMVYEHIATRSPNATVIATGYMPLVSAEGACEEAWFVSEADRAWAAGLTNDLNAEIRAAADRHSATFVLPADAESHTACAASEQRWTDITGLTTNAYPMHPTPAGQEAMAQAVKEQL